MLVRGCKVCLNRHVDQLGLDPWTAFLGAHFAGPEELRRFLARGGTPQVCDTDGTTALMVAAADGALAHVELLLAAGASAENWGRTRVG